ncbi:MAG: endonuclease/exonuclease/phosphatase family protein [Cyanobacteriota bacterium]
MIHKPYLLNLILTFTLPILFLAFVSAIDEENKNKLQPLNTNIYDTLKYDDLLDISDDGNMSEEVKNKVNYVLNNPVVDNTIMNSEIEIKQNKPLGKFIRAASWNIERGIEFDGIVDIFKNPAPLLKELEKTNSKNVETVKEQMAILREADIIFLTEVDAGMPRTEYRKVAEDLARQLGYNYAYGVEFLEVDPAHLGLEDYKWSEEKSLFPHNTLDIDKNKYRGLHGSAILSKFPLKNVRIVRLPKCYDWYKGEKLRVSRLEKLRRASSAKIFGEAVIREIRFGTRMALLADIDIPGFDSSVTLVATHLENRTEPKNRKNQMKYLLNNLYNVSNPIIIAGDFNTDVTDAEPKGNNKMNQGRFSKLLDHFKIYNIPQHFAITPLMAVPNVLRKHDDPTVKSLPFILPNPEKGLFSLLKKFDFKDDYHFDFRSVKGKYSGKKGNLADSNERSSKGFVPTYKFERSLYLGKYKLDWFFVKAYCKSAKDKESSYKFAPHFGRTLYDLNYSFKNSFSDHAPITVDLPLEEPPAIEGHIKKHKEKM